MKKLVSIFLALVMILAICVPAFAAENTTLTINGEAGREYVGYALLNLTTSLKTGTHHTAHDGDHTDDCYNFAYTVNEKYRAILQEEVFGNGRIMRPAFKSISHKEKYVPINERNINN